LALTRDGRPIMPGIDFIVDTREFMAMAKWYERAAPEKFAVANGMLLNNMAFGSRETILHTLIQGFTIRNSGFLSSRVRVNKNREWRDINRQMSEVGSVKGPPGASKETQFWGWREQQTGKKAVRKRVATLKGRGGSKGKQIKRGARMRRPFIGPDRFPRRRGFVGKNMDHRIQVMLRQLDRLKYSAPFIITGHSTIPPGLYIRGSGKNKYGQSPIQMLQSFDPKHKQPRRFLWMTKGVARWFQLKDVNREFIKISRRLIGQTYQR